MTPKLSCPPPPVPPNAPSDWQDSVDGNCFSNLQRLGRWTGRTKTVPSGTSPAPLFQAVTPASIGGGANPPAIYVLAHGWAPGYRAAVKAQGGNLRWWDKNAANSDGVWSSDWAWSPVTAPLSPAFPVNPTGLLQSIAAIDPNAVVLAYSWIDNSATESGDLNLDEVYRSEAYTHLNGLRLANALQQAIAPSFRNAFSAELRLIGHSHGSKVATVAALALQQTGRHVGHLTLLDPPEDEKTITINGANLLGFYLEQMQIMHPFFKCTSGAFVDNYVSCFGVGYDGAANLKNIVEVGLDPSKLYSFDDLGDQHSYSAAWYGRAAAGAAAQKLPPLGLAWPPPPATYLPALQQTWPTGTNQFSQWQLAAGAMSEIFTYSTLPLSLATVATEGNVRIDPGGITFGPAGSWPAYSVFQGSYKNSFDTDNYGIAFDLLWIKPVPGDYFVVTMESPDLAEQEVLLVLDGQSFAGGQTSVAINCDKSSSWFSSLSIYIYFLAAKGNLIGQVNLRNFRFVVVGSASGYLRSRRLAAAAEKLERRRLKAEKIGNSPSSTQKGATKSGGRKPPAKKAPTAKRSLNRPQRTAKTKRLKG